MLNQGLIQKLESYDGQGVPVLSTYLDLGPDRLVKRTYRVVFKDMVKEAREQLGKDEQEILQREADRVQAWLESEEPQGKGLALFSSDPSSLWETSFLPTRVQDHLVFEPSADVAPLLEILEDYERYAVVLVDKEKARLFTIIQGEIEESDAIKDFVPAKHPQSRYQKHHQAHVHWHLRHVEEALTDLLRTRSFDRLILAGPEEATSELRRMLPRNLATRLMAEVPLEVSARPAEVLEKTLEVARQIEREAEQRLLTELLDTVGAGGRATIGVDETLEALWLDEIRTLLVAEGAHPRGSECENCGRLLQGHVEICPVCAADMHAVHDVGHRAMARTQEQAGSVEVVHGDAAQTLRERGGGLGAFLWFK